jgi:hypothetical protein
MGDLAPFKKVLRWEKDNLHKALASGTDTSYDIAASRLAIEIMEALLKHVPGYVESFKLLEKVGQPAELLWLNDVKERVHLKLNPASRDPTGYGNKWDEYMALEAELRRKVDSVFRIRVPGQVLIVRYNRQTKTVINAICEALLRAFKFHEPDDDFLEISARHALLRLLREERKDLDIAYRIALELRPDITAINLPTEDRPTWVEAIEFTIGLIPIVGNAVAAYEAYSGKDLFGYQLSDVERGILGASVLLPTAGRLVKNGRALYTANRMAKLYGDDAFKWSYSLAMGERMWADAVGIARLKAADEAVASGKQVTKKAASELTNTLKVLADAAQAATPAAIDPKLVATFAKVAAKVSKLADLDSLAIGRIGAKGANINRVKGQAAKEAIINQVKGQILEELLENQIVKWLREGTGKKALGLEHIREPLHFIPGHLIRDADGLLLTDGIIVRQVDDVLDIVAVFEAKSGKRASRGLSHKSGRRTKLSDEDKAELQAEAEETLKELQERARLDGTTVTETLEGIMQNIKLSEAGGQIRSDVERLAEIGVFINARAVKVRSGPTSTKWFGVIPKDVKGDTIKAAIIDAGIKNVEIMGLNVTQAELQSAAKLITDSLKTP